MTVRGWVDILGISARRPGGRGAPCLSPRTPRPLVFPALLLFLAFALLSLNASLFATAAQAQQGQPGVVGLGDLVVTGFSGALPPPPGAPLPPGVNALDETFINPDGASLKIFDVTNPGGPPEAQLLNVPTKFQVFARDVGQVFGLALDKSDPANIYAASTSVHGLQIVVPDADGDGRPERIKLGQPGAQWMDGQFGLGRGGGPGTLWKINGETGEITKFADILGGGIPNSGPGLGNIAYDAKRKQLFVSDLDTGLIHRLDMAGNDLGAYDHGLQGRPANGMNAVPEDQANRLDITSPAFDAEDSGSWGLAAPERRVWGLAVRGDRLYYSVEEGPQIWSLGINQDGSFGADPRWELDVPADPNAYPVSDIAFQSNSLMLLAQRGGITSRYDYSQYQTPRKTRVLRYRLESPNDPATPSRWVSAPEDYAIGFPGIHRNSSGGIAIGYGYRKDAGGNYVRGSCKGTLWSTGDALRDNPVHGARLAQGGPLNVHGLQGNALSLVRPANVPPWETYFVDYDSQFDDPQAAGHVGDVEIARECGRKRTDVMDLRILKRAKPERCTVGNQCPFGVEIENTGTKTYSGPLVIQDIAHNGAQLIGHSPPPPGWDCREVFPGTGVYECSNPGVTLKPGQKTSLELLFQMPPWWVRHVYDNCAELRIPGAGVDERPYNNRSCAYVATIGPGHPDYVPDLQLEKFGLFGACDFFGLCEFVVRVTNVGAAPYTGQLNVNDFTTTPGATITDWAPKPDWNCALLAPDNYGCSTAGPVTLLPGDFRELVILTQGPPIAPGVTTVRNCAWIDWNGAPGDVNPFNEYDCAEISNLPPGHPDARAKVIIQKDAQPTCSRAGAGNPWRCLYAVRIKNSGAAPLIGPIEFTDELTPNPATLLGFGGGPGPWACVPGVGLAGPYTCTQPPVPGGLLPGQEVSIMMIFELPAATPVPGWQMNTATIKWDNDGDGADEDHQASAIAMICDAGSANCPQDLAMLKFPPIGPCLKGDACPFTVQVHNLGNAAFPAPVTVTDIPDPGAGAPNVLTPGWACVPAGGSYTCSNPAALPPGATTSFDLEFPILPGYASPTFENCAEVAPGPGNVLNFNDRDCATAVVPFPDLAPWSPSECVLGTDCSLDVKVENKGKLPFVGAAGLRGTLSPAVQIKSITGQTPGLSCKVTGFGKYECIGQVLNIAPGDAAKLKFIAVIPANFPHKQITHTKTMIWPDRKVKDTNPQNDVHTSIITIEQPKEPPPPPPQPVGKPDLAVSKTANQNSCRAGSPCRYTVRVTSAGTAPYSGKIVISDIITPANARLTGSGPAPWRCFTTRGGVNCTYPNTTLAPGQSRTLSLNFTLPRTARGVANNCATLTWGATQTRGSVRDVQSALAARGYNPGPADGKMGNKTRSAIRAFQNAQGLQPTGRIDQALLSALFGGAGGGKDSNPANNRACAASPIIAQAPPPPPQQCFGGKVRNSKGACVCPSNRPVWTGQQCIPHVTPPPPPPPQCTGGRSKKYVRGKLICACPSSRPVWNGRQCMAKPPVSRCPSGYSKVDPLKAAVLATQGWKIKTVGNAICAKKPRSACKSGKIRNSRGQCVCPSNKPYWNGKKCTQYSTYPIPGTGQTPTPGTSVPSEMACTGGRQRNRKGRCVCPSSRPVWTGRNCVPKLQQINPQQINPQLLNPQTGPILKLPGGGTIRIR
ncbi:putative peptidoglycan binding domain protein [bacterium BMS3Bbin10]|nr:putative peptidoglycan binding domain protein [bacterium BMS3Bbin10]